MNGSNQQSGGYWILWSIVLLFVFPGVFMVLAVLALLVALVVKAPKFTGLLVVVAGVGALIQFLTDSDSFSWDADDVYDCIVIGSVFLLFIIAGCKLLGWGLRGGIGAATATAKTGPSSIPSRPEPAQVWNRADESQNQTDEEKIRDAMEEAKAEAKRIMRLSDCPPDQKKKLFESVFLRKCQQRGVKVSEIRWKNRKHPPQPEGRGAVAV